ncbi:MAG TPA: hypothetical protein VNM48_09620, partial [Chloroflexota bacterium]|nr:hypothetical protein [Chloroflexota bacterium]
MTAQETGNTRIAPTRRTVLGASTAGLLALLAACGQAGSDGGAGAAKTQAPATIQWWDQEPPAFKQFAEQWLPQFNAKN